MSRPNLNVIVVGGSSGLGKVVSRLYAEAGYQVAIVSRNRPAFADGVANILHFPFDLEQSTVETAKVLAADIVRKSGKPSYLIFCQRYRGTKNTLANEIAVSLTSTGDLINAFSDYFDTDGDKAIAVVSSVYGDYVGSSQPLDYHVAKAGLNSLVRYFAVNLGSKGIRVNAISPLTYLKEESKHVYLNDQTRLDKYRKLVPLKRMGTAEECANTIKFLCSKQSSFVTGQNLYVDGGVSAIWPEELV